MLENVRGLLDSRFDGYRDGILTSLKDLGYVTHMQLLNASDYGVPQLRPRVVIVGIRQDVHGTFQYPEPHPNDAPTVGEAIGDLMSGRGWNAAAEWVAQAHKIAPTLVGGSKKHGGPDLGPVRARRAWQELGVDGAGVADEAPGPDFQGLPRLTPRMMARLQGFPDDFIIPVSDTQAYKQFGNSVVVPLMANVAQLVVTKMKELDANTVINTKEMKTGTVEPERKAVTMI